MARVQSVILREVRPAPDVYLTKKEGLAFNPSLVAVDAAFADKQLARNDADRVNLDLREDWPADRYYAVDALSPEGQWEVLVGRKTNMPEEYISRVSQPQSRVRKKAAGPGPGAMPVENVILREPPSLTAPPMSKYLAVERDPTVVVVDAMFREERFARNSADRFNLGMRQDWPADHFFAIEAPSPDEEGRWELLVGTREYMPAGLAQRVDNPARRARKVTGHPGLGATVVHQAMLRELPHMEAPVTKYEALRQDPEVAVVDAVFGEQRLARNAADRLNLGLREDWPSSVYYAAEAFRLEGGSDSGEEGVWELLVGVREHMPESLARRVNNPGHRGAKKSTTRAGRGAEMVTQAITRTPPQGDLYETKKEALLANPERVVIDAVFPKHFPMREVTEEVEEEYEGEDGETAIRVVTRPVIDPATGQPVLERVPFTLEDRIQHQASARAAAYLLNTGGRSAWPSDRFYAVPEPTPELDEDGEPTGRYEVPVGLRSHMPEGWRARVEAAGARKRRRRGEGWDAEERSVSEVDDSRHVEGDRDSVQ